MPNFDSDANRAMFEIVLPAEQYGNKGYPFSLLIHVAYVLDDQGRLRRHMAIFIDGLHIRDRTALTDPVPADAVVDLIQALSGG